MVYSGAWGKLIREKNQKSKISWHCPFKPVIDWLIVQGEAVIPRWGKFSGLKIFQRFDICLFLKPVIDWFIVQGDAVIPRSGKFAGLKICQRFHFYLVLKPVTGWLIDTKDGQVFWPQNLPAVRHLLVPEAGGWLFDCSGRCCDSKEWQVCWPQNLPARFHFYLALKPLTDWLIVQGEAVIPRRGKYAGVKNLPAT